MSDEYKPDEYASRTGQSEVPVQSDDAPVDDPVDAGTADSDEQLGTSLKSLSANTS